jgi:thiol-disulfide isomerase/thioredoxin
MTHSTCGDTGPVVRRSPRLLAVLLSVSLAVLVGCTGGTDAVDQTAGGEFRFVAGTPSGETIGEADRKAAPDVTGTLVGGEDWDLAALKGKVVVLNFWGPWCGPCRVETPEFDQVARATKAQGVEFVGIAVKDTEPAVASFLDKNDISFPSVFDRPGRTVQRFRDLRVAGFPFTIVIDRQGRVAAVYVTAQIREDIEPVVTRLAAEG